MPTTTRDEAREARAAALRQVEANATGTEGYTRFGLVRRCVATDGLLAAMKAGGCFWLGDAVASYYLRPGWRKDLAGVGIHFWTLTVDLEKGAGVLEMRHDSDRPVLISQDIRATNFPLPEFRVWVQPMHDEAGHIVLMLPSEY